MFTSGPATRSRRCAPWRGAFLPIHWGTFSLAMHAWDEPAETLLALAPQRGVQLVMPRLGEPVEPRNAEAPTPWWRAVDRSR